MSKNTDRTHKLKIESDEFRKIGHELINSIADFYETITERPVTTSESALDLASLLTSQNLPEAGTNPAELVKNARKLLIEHSLHNGHPKFMGFITSSPAQIGALADLLAAAVNPNVGANILSPMATAIEKQTVQWLAEFIGVPGWSGLLVSGGNFANFTGFLAARTAKSSHDLKEKGLQSLPAPMVFYCSTATHTWIEKAAFLFGHGKNAIRWIECDTDNTMNKQKLEMTIIEDISKGLQPFLLIGNAGDVSTGAVDDLNALSVIARKYDLWFHVDGAYGAPAASLPEFHQLFRGLEYADSIAIDPHKWLYAPLEAGCVLVKDQQHLLKTFSSHPVYYNFEESDGDNVLNYYEFGFQNSRCFRALKVWLALQQAGREGYRQLIREDIALAEQLYHEAEQHPDLQAITHNLSITTFQYVPKSVSLDREDVNQLNKQLVEVLQKGGELFLSDAVILGRYCLRACIVNYRTTPKDITESIDIIVREGERLLSAMK
ncbi:MAG: pyridoxal phosphate-dependent decarboxylase family protein [Sphingobacteriales bacterium]